MNTTELDEILEERGKEYGDFGDIAVVCEAAEKIFLSPRMTDVQRHAMKMIIVKQARLACGRPDHRDSWLDIAGYAELAADRIPDERL